jgi:uncharacterized protein YdaU (DUF1376 family)
MRGNYNMHYYSFNIGDYASATAHLEPLEDLAYRRLMDLYYSSEQPIPEDLKQTARLIRMRTHSEFIATVLEEFFTLENDGWHSDRVDVEIFKFHEKSFKASKSAKSRWKKAKQKQKVKTPCERIANAVETHSEGNANQEPLTTNQEPLTNIKDPLVKSKIDRDIEINSAFDYFWLNMFLPKKAKLAASKSFAKAMKGIDTPMHFANHLVRDTETRFNNQQQGFDRLHPTTYLNGQRWEDDYTIDKDTSTKPSIEGDGTDWRRFESEML